MVSLRVCLVVAPVVLVSIGALKKDTRAPCEKQFGRQSWLYSDVWLLLSVESAADLLHLFFVELNADVSDYHVALAGLGYLVLTTLYVLLKRRASTFEALGFSEAPLAYLVSTLNVISAVVFGTGAVVLVFGA